MSTHETKAKWIPLAEAAQRPVVHAGFMVFLRTLANTLGIGPRRTFELVRREVNEIDPEEIDQQHNDEGRAPR